MTADALHVDTAAVRRAAALLAEAATTFLAATHQPGAGPGSALAPGAAEMPARTGTAAGSSGGALGSSDVAASALLLLDVRAEQNLDAARLLAASAVSLGNQLTGAADSFERCEEDLGQAPVRPGG